LPSKRQQHSSSVTLTTVADCTREGTCPSMLVAYSIQTK